MLVKYALYVKFLDRVLVLLLKPLSLAHNRSIPLSLIPVLSMSEEEQQSLFKRIEAGLREYYVTGYRRSFARAQRDEEDLFMLLVFAESLGIPNPAAFYTMELLPIVYDRFHDWHVRMGMERSPLDHVSCC
ncbi:MAG: hypothetical protein DHS20C12_27340 [Pseudohongiella sp.]|nr:MAG: hypothetical protein DHS20C12_27340 [Pseudohongiella sp.]